MRLLALYVVSAWWWWRAAVADSSPLPVNTINDFDLDTWEQAVNDTGGHARTPIPTARRKCGYPSSGKMCPVGQCCSVLDNRCGRGLWACADMFCQPKFSYSCDQFVPPWGRNTMKIPRNRIGRLPYGQVLDKCHKPGMLALTFNEGPFHYTAALLDLLESHNAKATFFITGNNIRKGFIDDPSTPWPALLHRMHRTGHQLGSHGWTLRNLKELVADWDKDRQHSGPGQRQNLILFNEMAFRNLFGFVPTYFRPPFNECDKSCLTLLGDLGYHVIGHTHYLQDHFESVIISKKLIPGWFHRKRHRRHSFILEASDAKWKTAMYLAPLILRRARELGWRVVTVGECLGDAKRNWYRPAAFLHDYNFVHASASGTSYVPFRPNATSWVNSTLFNSTAYR